jgi:hypothetical protein
MAQNERTGRGGKGERADRPSDPDTDPRSSQAQPAPEAPVGEVSEAGDDGDDSSGGGGGDGDEKPRSEQEVLAELKDAQDAVDGLEAELAAIRDESRRDEENDRIIADYAAQVAALKAGEAELELYRTAEITFLEKMLPAEVREAVAKVAGELQDELDGLAGDVDNAQAALDLQQRLIDEAKAADENATRNLDRLVKPVDPIRAKLRDGEALRTAANKAEEAGDYALAFWLVMDTGRLRQRLAEDPISEPEALRKEIDDARRAQAAARAGIPALEAPVAGLAKALDGAKAAHETARSTLDERVLQRVSELNPKSAEPA